MNLLLTSNFPMAENEPIAQEIHNFGDKKNLYVGYSNSTKKLESYSFSNIDFINIA